LIQQENNPTATGNVGVNTEAFLNFKYTISFTFPAFQESYPATG
jgi:hypothetical protein